MSTACDGKIERSGSAILKPGTIARFASQTPAAVLIGRSELFGWLACLLLANQIFRLEAVSTRGVIEALLSALSNKSAFYYLAWYAVLRLLFESSRRMQATGADIALALVIAPLNFLSANSVSWLSVTAVGAYLFATSRGDRKLEAAAVVLTALGINGLWGPLLFDVFAIYLLRLDAALVGSLLALTQPGMTWEQTIIGARDGHSVFIYSPCSSFHNLSLGLLGWISLTKLARTHWVRSDVLVALGVAAAVILLNASRLYLMALSPDHFTYWHHGFGQQIFAGATTVAVLSISVWGVLHTARAS